jgi:hypothetical protein
VLAPGPALGELFASAQPLLAPLSEEPFETDTWLNRGRSLQLERV